MPLDRGQEGIGSNYSYRNSGWVSEKNPLSARITRPGNRLPWVIVKSLSLWASKEELDKCLPRWQRHSWILEAEYRLHKLQKSLPTLFCMGFFDFTLLTYIREFFIFIETHQFHKFEMYIYSQIFIKREK